MRTTLTLDDDIAAKLAELAHDLRRPFKDIVNETLRRGLGPVEPSTAFVVRPFTAELLPGIDPRGFNKLNDELETEEFLARYGGHR